MSDLNEQLAAARAEAAKTGDALAALEADLAAAVAAQDFTRAEQTKGKLPDARLAHMLAEGKAASFANALEQFARADAERQAAAAEVERQRQAREMYERAYAAEQEAMAALQRHLADVEPGIDAVRQSLRAAVAAEQAATMARRDAHEAAVVLGEAEPGVYVAQANQATARIEASRLLSAIAYGKQL